MPIHTLISDEATLDKAELAVVSEESFLGENGVAGQLVVRFILVMLIGPTLPRTWPDGLKAETPRLSDNHRNGLADRIEV